VRLPADYGLDRRATGRRRRRFEALDGTAIVIRRGDDARLPKAIGATRRCAKPSTA
jgi:hypothetical protein